MTSRAWVLAVAALLLFSLPSGANLLSGGTGTSSPAYYVATNGSDSNNGGGPSSGSAFATVAHCQTAMQGSGTKSCYVEPGTYAQTITLTSSDNGETVKEDPAQGTNTAVFTGMNLPATAGFLVNSGTATVSGLIGGCGTTGTITNVAAATGVAATDTANINSAISTRSSGGGGTVRFPAGTYVINGSVTVASGVWMVGTSTPGAPGTPSTMIYWTSTGGNLAFNGTITNLSLCGINFVQTDAPSVNVTNFSTGSGTFGPIFMEPVGSSNVYVIRNVFTYCTICIHFYQSNSSYIQGNSFSGGSGTSFLLGESITFEDSTSVTMTSDYITDNQFQDIWRYAIEGCFSSTTQTNLHIDRNTFTNWATGSYPNTGGDAISWVCSNTAGGSNNTLWGNTFAQAWNYDTSNVGTVEFAGSSYTLSNNTTNNHTGGTNDGMEVWSIAWGQGSAFLNNTYNNMNSVIYEQDGGYAGGEWIGSNTYNGSAVVGCGSGPAYCSPWPGSPAWTPFPSEPTLSTPSQQFF